MPVDPALLTYIVRQYHAEIEARAYSRRLERQARGAARLAKAKIPSRLPRYWRWRYLRVRASLRRRSLDRRSTNPS